MGVRRGLAREVPGVKPVRNIGTGPLKPIARPKPLCCFKRAIRGSYVQRSAASAGEFGNTARGRRLRGRSCRAGSDGTRTQIPDRICRPPRSRRHAQTRRQRRRSRGRNPRQPRIARLPRLRSRPRRTCRGDRADRRRSGERWKARRPTPISPSNSSRTSPWRCDSATLTRRYATAWTQRYVKSATRSCAATQRRRALDDAAGQLRELARRIADMTAAQRRAWPSAGDEASVEENGRMPTLDVIEVRHPPPRTHAPSPPDADRADPVQPMQALLPVPSPMQGEDETPQAAASPDATAPQRAASRDPLAALHALSEEELIALFS